MKRILTILFCLVGIVPIIMADEREDLMDSYLLQANYAYLSGDLTEARTNYDNALKLYRDINKKSISRDTVYAQYMAALGRLCYQLEDYNSAISAASEAAKIYKTVYNSNHLLYVQQLNDLATFNADAGNYKQAITYASEANTLIKSILGPKDQYYAFSLAILAFYYSKLEMFEDAALYYLKNKEATESIFSKESVYYLASLTNLADTYSNLNDYPQAIQYTTEAIKIRSLLLKNKKDYEHALLLDKLAKYYSLNNDFDHALQFGIEALNIIKETDSIESKDHAAIANNVANYQAHLGRYNEAIQSETESISIFEKLHETENLDYALALNNLAAYYAHIGSFEQGLNLGIKALNIRTSLSDTESSAYAMTLSNLANCHAHLGHYNEAIQLCLKAKDICKKGKNTNGFLYTTLLSNLANYYAYNKMYKEAIHLGEEVANIKKSRSESLDSDYAISLLNLSNYYFYCNDLNKAIKLGSDAMMINKRALGIKHPQYITSLSNLAYFYAQKGNFNNAVQLIREYLPVIRDNVINTFSGLTANERMIYWSQHETKLNDVIPLILIYSTTPDAASLLYNFTALFAKGLLISTELEMTKLIQESGDVVAPQVYLQLRQIRQLLNEQYSKPFNERIIDCDSLERASSELERQLASRVKEIGDYTRNLSITWQDVRSMLSDNDIAIEFLSYPGIDNITEYVALTLCKNDIVPVLTPLFTELQLKEAAGDNDTYQNSSTDALVWGGISDRLKGKSNVYFSASGLLHNIGIEYLPSMEGKDCHRLSSTRELVTHQASPSITSATLYGDIDYNASYASIKSSTPNSIEYYASNSLYGQNRGNFDYRSMRYGVSPLPATRDEINEVSSLLKTHGIHCEKLTGNLASEESFKALSGQRKSLLHISTHGFYYTTEDAENMSDNIRMMFIGDDRPTHFEDQSLLRCGLCLAGANQTLSGESQPSDGQGDGILNALEIAQTDLRGLDLVVLSACQTALGDVSQGEGVFGLQRGFKKAGAQSILMSLWEVDDEFTHLFMTEFYRGWTSGMTKTAALRNAQSIVKAKYPEPRHWAAFILLDALD